MAWRLSALVNGVANERCLNGQGEAFGSGEMPTAIDHLDPSFQSPKQVMADPHLRWKIVVEVVVEEEQEMRPQWDPMKGRIQPRHPSDRQWRPMRLLQGYHRHQDHQDHFQRHPYHRN